MPLAITVETALLAAVTSSKTASRVLLTGGTGVNRTQIVVTIPPPTGTGPPQQLLAPERATIGTPSSAQMRATCATSSALPGMTTASGSAVSGLASYW